MNKRKKNSKNIVITLKAWMIFNIALSLLLIATSSLLYVKLSQPLARFATGSCPGSTVRYSVARKEFDKFSEGYEKARVFWEKENRAEADARARGVAQGCSGGEMHELYYW